MRTHLRRDVAPKSGPTPNREQLRVFYNANEKLVIFWYFSITIGKYRYTVLQLWRLAGRLFWRPTRRRCAPVWLLINGITSGFVLRPRSILYSRNSASFGHRYDAVQTCTDFYSKPPYRCGDGTTYRNASSYLSPAWKCDSYVDGPYD